MTDASRISPEEARDHVRRFGALLVCAYDDPAQYKSYFLDGSIALDEFRARTESLPKDREVIFYCA